MRDSVLVSALAASWLADRPHGIYDEAVERLLDVRDCIHLVAGKDTNLMLTPYQAKVAAMLGLADPTWPENERAAYSIDDLQTLLARLGRTIAFSLDATAARAERTLVHDKPRFSFFQIRHPRAGGKREAPTFDESSKTLTFSAAGEYTVGMADGKTSTTNRIEVTSAANITLDGVNIDVSGTENAAGGGGVPLIGPGGLVG